MPRPPTMMAMRGASVLSAGSLRGCAKTRERPRAVRRRSSGSAPWRRDFEQLAGRPAPSALASLGLPGIDHVLVLAAGAVDDGDGLAARRRRRTVLTVDGGVGRGLSVGMPSWRACCCRRRRGALSGTSGGRRLVATTAVGSPPSGSLTKIAQAHDGEPEQRQARPPGSAAPPPAASAAVFRLVLAERGVQVIRCHGAKSSRIIRQV